MLLLTSKPQPLCWVAAWGRSFAAVLSRFKNIDFNRPFHKKGHDVSRVLFCGFRRPKGRLHPAVIQMLGGSEFRLRRGFTCGKTLVRRISAAGQKAGWVILLYLFEISKYRF